MCLSPACPLSDVNCVDGRDVHTQGQRRSKSKKYSALKIAGQGTFGTVYLARVQETGEKVAIKKVLQDPRFKNRELDIMKELNHENVTVLRHYFFSHETKKVREGRRRPLVPGFCAKELAGGEGGREIP